MCIRDRTQSILCCALGLFTDTNTKDTLSSLFTTGSQFKLSCTSIYCLAVYEQTYDTTQERITLSVLRFKLVIKYVGWLISKRGKLNIKLPCEFIHRLYYKLSIITL